MKYTHLIVTKVNIKWLPQSQNPEWREKRIHLLNNILRPSLEAQTDKNFKFVTLWGYEPIGKIDNEYQVPIFINDNNGVLYTGNQLFSEMLPKLVELIDDEYVLTTRIDSDNAISHDFIEQLHQHINETDVPFYYDISHMDMINLITRDKKRWPAKGTSAFISVMERKANYKCIPYKSGHATVGTYVKGIKFEDLNGICCIHDGNAHMKRTLGVSTDFNEKNKYGIKI